ncbi:MAG: mannitol-1-phosphate 5-dehydrogenase [Eubacteriales bacterium]|nr:mannitol-1-phosphate 5-dehydrogenase [Eubacteriales bacterium]
MKKAVMIGAGQIGRGFIGMLLEGAGYHVVFADINRSVIDDINTRHEYTVHLMDTECVDTVVKNISAVDSLSPALIDEYVSCSLICTSVGLTAFPYIAPALAQGITARKEAGITEPLNVIACENGLKNTEKLRNLIYEKLSEEDKKYADTYIGFPDCAVDRIIPPVEGIAAAETVVERYHEWDVERSGFKGEIPEIPGMNVVDDLSAFIERKLFTLNGPNAVTGCLGYLKGYTTVKEALEDQEIYELTYGMMEECGEMLSKRHGFTAEEMRDYRDSLIRRFLNPYIIDSVTRVAREPIRKLAPDDRIIAPMNYAHSYGIATPHYYKGIATVLAYSNPDDEQSMRIQKMIKENGVKETLRELCAIEPESETAAEVERIYKDYHPC